ncbi:hypothetical protein F5X68DRAFT_245530 [Plectosphaerella plurivora]|uniref:Zn(2)-C6 fungal-type domain-containing protein n=1 Tax=Plectosphaerella plurivora TaxID=936078 RepID=A0A9P8V6S3_9PEZI|nr:hypothetical protein F5X68DRAFT_245530 [Plectosphaerella plurivora]
MQTRRHTEQACDRCRRRKIKCDGQSPACGRCVAAQTDCEFNLPVAKRGPKFRRGQAGRPEATVPSPEGSSDRIDNTSSVLPSPLTPGASLLQPREKTPLQTFGPSPSWQPQEYHHQFDDTHLSPIVPFQGQGLGQSLQTPAREAHAALVAEAANVGVSLKDVAEQSLALAVQRFFPFAPCFDPTAARKGIEALLLPSAPDALFTGTPEERLDNVRAYGLITAVCSYNCARASPDQPDRRLALASHFLAASRQALAAHQDDDVQRPDSRSLSIRAQQAASLHYMGRGRLSRYLLGQAFRLAVDMRLDEEASYNGLDLREAQLQRNMFWFLYTSDKSASMMSGTAPMLHNGPVRHAVSSMGVEAVNWDVDLMTEFDPVLYTKEFETQLGQGIALARRIWTLGGEISRIMLVLFQSLELTMTSDETAFQKIADLYLTFCSLPDLLPPCLYNPDAYTDAETDISVLGPRRMMFWMQKADVIATHACLRLILTQQAFRQGCPSLLGMTADPGMLDLKATDLAEGLALAIRELPHESLVANGESLVEKLRQFGVALLEIGERSSNNALRVRARRLLTTLLDTIASLDSKASDDLVPEPSV